MKKILIDSIEEKGWSQIWEIYESSFPIYERRNLESHMKAMKNQQFFCSAFLEEETVVGILFYWEFENYKYIEHFAINGKLRGKNYGSRILEKFCDTEKKIVLEIEPPIDEMTIKRLHFYEKHGFYMNDFKYIHPSFSKNTLPHRLDILSNKAKLTDKEFVGIQSFISNVVLKYVEK